MMNLTPEQEHEMRRVKAYFPYRKVVGVLEPDGTFSVFANATTAKANNHARNTGGLTFVLEVVK
jgi:hypothetical protein